MVYTRIIKNEDEYEAALEEVSKLIVNDPPAGTDEADRLELLVLLVKAYEDSHYPLEFPTVIEAVRFRMEQEGLRQQDLVSILGSKGRVSEMLNGNARFHFPWQRHCTKNWGFQRRFFYGMKLKYCEKRPDIIGAIPVGRPFVMVRRNRSSPCRSYPLEYFYVICRYEYILTICLIGYKFILKITPVSIAEVSHDPEGHFAGKSRPGT